MHKYPYNVPFYDEDQDFNTNAPSYYDFLARLNKMIKVLAERIGKYDEELAKRFEEWDKQLEELPDELKRMLQDWFDDGILAEILAELMLEEYARKDWVNEKFGTKEWIEGLIETVNERIEIIEQKLKNGSVTYTVGSSAAFSTLQKTIDYVDNLPVKPKKVTIDFTDGFVLNEEVSIINKDLHYVEITGAKTILFKPDQTYLDRWQNNVNPALFYGRNSIMPVINIPFQYSGSKTGNYRNISGIVLERCTIRINDGNGFTGFPNNGMYAIDGSNVVANACYFSNNGSINDSFGNGFHMIGSQLTAIGTVVDKCGNDGFNFYSGCIANVNGSSGNGCGHHGLNATQACVISALNCEFKDVKDNAVVAFANTQIDLRNSICTNSGNSAVVAQNGSHISFDNGDVTGAGFDGLQSKHGASISFDGGKANNCGQGGAHLTRGLLTAEGAEFNNNGREGIRGNTGEARLYACKVMGNEQDNINARYGSSIYAINSDLSNAGLSGARFTDSEMIVNGSTINNSGAYGLHSTAGGKCNASNCSIDRTTNTGVYASGGEINCTASKITNSGNYAVQALRGAQIIAYNVQASGSKNFDFAVSSSATIQASESTGTTNRPVNEMTHNGYILSNTLVFEG